MKYRNILSPIIVFSLLLLASCSQDWLKPEPLSFYAPENVFVDEAGFESGLVNCRKEMNADNHGDRAVHFLALDFMYTDLACSIEQCDFTKNTPSTVGSRSALQNLFLRSYVYIKNANTIISRIDAITWSDPAVRNRILSEAYWFRAYWYYRLVNSYGDIPWIGEELTDAKLDYKSTSRWAILGQLQKDLEFARQWLPATPARLGNVTKGAVNHLLTKIYLANGEFDSAISAATEVINGPYTLMKQRFGVDKNRAYYNLMWDLHRVQNKNLAENSETIYATVDRADQAPATWWDLRGTFSMRHFGPSYWRVLDATGNRATNWNTVSGDSLGSGDAAVRTNNYFIYSLWAEKNFKWNTTPDLRRSNSNWIEMGAATAEIATVRDGSPNLGEPLSKKYLPAQADTVETWFSWPYYKTYAPTPKTPYWVQPHGGQGDWYIFRLAETYLLRAEAYYWKGQTGLAAEDINKVRERAKAPLIAASDVTLDYIFDERARELYMEEPRHSEMVRVSFTLAKLGRDGYSLSGITSKNWYHDRVMRYNHFYKAPLFQIFGNTATLLPQHMLWPIPQSVITANTLGRINQNFGYDGAELNEPALETIP
ncbi:RagB/SusD family nutrient uptake outer membrane protein [Dyadobacter sp. CY323]|uniref:RagB/SusD family nutrient uptake outer membrane protein n=1 Tax=Dyadobacter sp. CY323 TaxID=2907302 RepID=UPI001F2C2885|nr:RagB/SusD family nutrient uptake outer membrane protein [Dyadobacter sp. CY323]MCE6992639.1 RagB/SusD family nutrient uptake outer membrane protein [Dyadobacter sp. CY323]